MRAYLLLPPAVVGCAVAAVALPWRGMAHFRGTYAHVFPETSHPWGWTSDGPGLGLRLVAAAIIVISLVALWRLPRRIGPGVLLLGLAVADAVITHGQSHPIEIGVSGSGPLPRQLHLEHRSGWFFALATALLLIVLAAGRALSRPADPAPAIPAGHP